MIHTRFCGTLGSVKELTFFNNVKIAVFKFTVLNDLEINTVHSLPLHRRYIHTNIYSKYPNYLTRKRKKSLFFCVFINHCNNSRKEIIIFLYNNYLIMFYSI